MKRITRSVGVLGISAGMLAAGWSATTAMAADDTIKIGVLHSLSGTMAISETTLKDTVLMMVDDLNASGGLLGKQVEAVVVDPASDWPLFAEKARELIEKEKVAAVFGCWTSVSRKSVLPVFEELNGLLFYPVQYEGEESSRNVFYTGAAPNQQAIPAVEYLMSEDGGGAQRWVLLGTDYVTIVTEVKAFASEGKPTAVVSTINGDANVPFYKELGNQGISAEDIPVIAFSVGEEELSGLDTTPLVGHLAAWNYFMSVDSEENDGFIDAWQTYIGSEDRVVNDPMEAHYIGFQMWAQAVRQAGSTNIDAVRQAMYGQEVRSLSGYDVTMNTNHHLSKPVMIGEIQDDGQFDIVWQTDGVVVGDAWSDFIPESSKLTADWTFPWVCGNCETPIFVSDN
jgi:urea transport system substrate-binding protein